MEGHFIYIVQTRECRRMCENVYKIGRSENCIARLKSYGRGSLVLLAVSVQNSKLAERHAINEFKRIFKQKTYYGTEYFEGNPHEMQNVILHVAQYVSPVDEFGVFEPVEESVVFTDSKDDISDVKLASTEVDHWAVTIKLFANYCNENGYAFNGNNVYKKEHDVFYSPVHFATKIQDDIPGLIKDKVFVTTESVSALWVLMRPNKIGDLVKSTQDPLLGFKQFYYNRNIVAFSNGFLNVVEWTFSSYKDGIPENVYAKQFFDVEFDLKWLTENWKFISTPVYDTIWKCQVKNEDALEVAYGLLGQLHYPMKDNNFQVCPYIKGGTSTGKSTLIGPIRDMFPEEKIGSIDHNQKVFGMASLRGKYVCIVDDTNHDIVTSMGINSFKAFISGEKIVLPVRNSDSFHGILDCHTLICSNCMQDVREVGEIQRRLAVFLFSPVEGGDSSLSEKLKKETPYIFIKTILAYRQLKVKYKNIPFNDWGIDYFDRKYVQQFCDEYLENTHDEKKGLSLKQIKDVIKKSQYKHDIHTGHSLKDELFRVLNTDCLSEGQIRGVRMKNIFRCWVFSKAKE